MTDDLDFIEIDPSDLTDSQASFTQVETTADTAPIVETPAESTPTTQETTAPATETPAGKTFTQQELDQIVEKRLSRERAAHEKAIKQNPILSGIERVAQKSGMTADALLAALERQQIEQLADSEGLSYESAERLVRAEAKAAEADAVLSEKQAQAAAQEAERKEFADFVSAFPDVPADKIPASVWEARAAGKPLAEAYRDHEAKALKSELETLKQQLANTKRAPISGGVGSHGTVAVESSDPFLQGFDSI